MADRTLHYFAVGGTGCLTVEPLLHLSAAGLGPARLGIIAVEAAAVTSALGRALNLIDLYTRVRSMFCNPSEGFLRTELIRVELRQSFWSPLGDGTSSALGEQTLEMYVQRARMDGRLSNALSLLDLLFSPQQQ